MSERFLKYENEMDNTFVDPNGVLRAPIILNMQDENKLFYRETMLTYSSLVPIANLFANGVPVILVKNDAYGQHAYAVTYMSINESSDGLGVYVTCMNNAKDLTLHFYKKDE